MADYTPQPSDPRIREIATELLAFAETREGNSLLIEALSALIDGLNASDAAYLQRLIGERLYQWLVANRGGVPDPLSLGRLVLRLLTDAGAEITYKPIQEGSK